MTMPLYFCPGDHGIRDRWQVQPLKRSLAHHAADWDGLNRRFLAGHPMQDSRFVNLLLRHFGDGTEHLCRYERGGVPLGMCILKPARAGVWTTFLPPQTQVGPMILADARGLGKLIPQLPGLAGQVDFLCQDPAFSPLARGIDLPQRRMPHVQTMNISLEGDFEAYRNGRSSNLRHAIRRRANRLAKAGLEPRLVCLAAPGDMAAAVTRYGRLEVSGWKGRAGTAVSGDNDQGRFYAELLERFAETGEAVAYEYWIGNRHAASELAIACGRMMIFLKTAYDEELAEYAPGRLMLLAVIEDAFSRLPGGVIEFYTNAKPEQLAWATGQRWIEHVSLYRSRSVEQFLGALKKARNLAQQPVQALARRLRPPSPALALKGEGESD